MSSNDGIGRLRAIEQQFDSERASVVDRKSLEDARARYLSRKSGLLTLELQNLGKLPADQRAEFGRVANRSQSQDRSRRWKRCRPTIDEREKTAMRCSRKRWTSRCRAIADGSDTVIR